MSAAPAIVRLRERARIHALLRDFFAARGVLEVVTPILSKAANSDPNIESFRCDYLGPATAGPGPRWLRTSPEFFHKRLLAAGSGDIYEIAPVFRNGEYGPRHQPEFSLLEWYRVGFDHHRLAAEAIDLLTELTHAFQRPLPPLRVTSYRDWFLDALGIDPLDDSIEALRKPLARYDIQPDGLGRDDWLDLLRSHCLEPLLADDGLLVVHGFPASQAALARLSSEDPRTAERFEVYLGRQELANGYHELGDPDEQRRRFQADLRLRAERGQPQMPIDESLLAALPDLPACAGVALGIDRLHQWLVGASNIGAVRGFDFAQS